MDDVRLVEFFAIAIDDAVAKVNAVARNSNDAFDHVEPSFGGREEDHDIASVHLAIGKQRSQVVRGWRELHAIDKHVVADQQGVLHRTGRDLKGLQDECDDE